MKQSITVEKPAGLWLINGKKYSECNHIERMYFNYFLTTQREPQNLTT